MNEVLQMENLRTAVEWAESQEVVGFEAWWENFSHYRYDECQAAWAAAQQAERERIKELILQTHGFEAANLLRKIDATTE